MDGNKMSEWKPIETAPRDGTLFLGRNADHLSFGMWPMLRHVKYVLNEQTLTLDCIDLGGWLIARDNDPAIEDIDGTPYFPFSIAMDKHNESVKYEWKPLNGEGES